MGEILGRLIADRYRLRRPIGSGGMGEVWEAYDEKLADRKVAVKMMLAERPSMRSSGDSEALDIRRERFLREVRTTAAIEHLGIPAVFDAGVDPVTDRLFVVMQLIAGRQLQYLIDETDHDDEPLSIARAAAIGAQVASVLFEVHRGDVVHRDIKPTNLMLTPGGIVKVLDFGVAALTGSGSGPRLTQVGETVGTPPYMSPEQAMANKVGPSADIYALACTLTEVLTGQPPFARTASKSHQWHHISTPPKPITHVRPGTPEGFESLLLAMLEKEPEDRPDAAEVYERLLRYTTWTQGAAFPANIPELDPCLAFTRPLGGSMRRSPRSRPHVIPGPPVTDLEVQEIGGRVEELLQKQHFVPAIDLLTEALGRAADPTSAHELIFKLAHTNYLAGNYTEAADLFVRAGVHASDAYGSGDLDVQLARYYLGKCREELGEVSGAIEAFRDVVGYPLDAADEDAVDRYLDALDSLLRLYAVARQADLVRGTEAELRTAILGLRPLESAEMIAELDGWLTARRADLLAEPDRPADG
ncbi:MAG: protein kinase [Streptosporangiaceae bacterium]